MEDRRDAFLLEMYKQMLNDINRHILVVWQSVGVLVSAFAFLSLVEKQVIPLDVAVSLIVVLAGWAYGHLLDAGYWYNRNLVIIANIERLFLTASDLKLVHYYFGVHRPDNKTITHLRLQQHFAVTLATLVLLYHFYERVLPGLSLPLHDFDPIRSLPYIFAAAAVIYAIRLSRRSDRKYAEMLKNSPGATVDTTGIKFGEGHGFPAE
jgi:hypothetical protein